MNKFKKMNWSIGPFLSVLMGTLIVVCIYGCGKSTAEFVSSEDFLQEGNSSLCETETIRPDVKPDADLQTEATLWVYVCGQVNAPGVYVLAEGSRVCDAFLAAGGLTEEAAKDYWNQARLLSDGEMIYVPTEEEAGERILEADNVGNADDGKININTANKEGLMTLPGIGEAKAESIIAYRDAHGGFSSIEEIMEVEGIKEGMYKKIKDYIEIN